MVTVTTAPLMYPPSPPQGRSVSYLLGALHLLNHLSGDSGLAGCGAWAGLRYSLAGPHSAFCEEGSLGQLCLLSLPPP